MLSVVNIVESRLVTQDCISVSLTNLLRLYQKCEDASYSCNKLDAANELKNNEILFNNNIILKKKCRLVSLV